MIREELPDEDTFGVELVASELVTNVIRHAKTDLVVSVAVDGAKVRIEVVDGSSILPAARDLSKGSNGGLGLRLVEEISEAWGAEQRPDGKVVWAEVRIDESVVDPV